MTIVGLQGCGPIFLTEGVMATIDQLLRAGANLLVEKQVLAEQVGELTRQNAELQQQNTMLSMQLQNATLAYEAAAAESADLKTSILDKLVPSKN